MLPQALAVIQGKGGVGKTSCTAGLSGLFAAAGRRVLTVDIDPQANLGRDLGYYDEVDARGDGGRALLGALHGYPVEPIRDVRPNLDCISAGDATEELTHMLMSREMRRPGSAQTAIADALTPLARDYDLILIDCPPSSPLLQKATLSAVQYVLIPTRADDASIDGLLKVDSLFAEVRGAGVNPSLHLLGAFLFGVGIQSKRISDDARRAIADCLGGDEHVLATQIRYAEGAAQDCRRLGLLPHELEAKLPEAKRARFAALRARRAGGGRHRVDGDTRISGSAAGLAQDYSRLAQEVVARIRAHRQAQVSA
ncbi:MAG: ParA family protein [Pseudonocardiales bacterium]|nr:ParA family protein [Pseudonocardiales bacterium]